MSDDRPSADDPRITAYALGELDAAEIPAVEAALRADPALRATVEEIRAFAGTLENALAHEAEAPAAATAGQEAPPLSRAESAAAIAPADKPVATGEGEGRRERPRTARPRGKWIVFPQFYFIAGGLAAAALAVMVALYRDTFDEKERARSESLRVALESRQPPEPREGSSRIIAVQLAGPTAPEQAPPSAAVAETPAPAARWRGYDLGRAGYVRVRQFVEERRRPPAEAVRPWELLNSFRYRYPAPPAATLPGDAPALAAALEVAEAPWAPARRLVRIGLRAREVAATERPAANLVFLFGGAGAANAPDRVALVKESLRLLVGALRADDRVAFVTMAGGGRVVLPSTPVARADEVLRALDALGWEEAADFSPGLVRAYDLARANFVAGGRNCVVWCTAEGFAGGWAGADEVAGLVKGKADSGLSLTAIDFGSGGGPSASLQRLAAGGNGHYAYIDTSREARRLFAEELPRTLATVAREVSIQVEFNPAKVASYRLIGYEDHVAARERPVDAVAALGELDSSYALTALYEIVPAEAEVATTGAPVRTGGEAEARMPGAGAIAHAGGEGELLTLRLRYHEPKGAVHRTLEFPLLDRGDTFAIASADFRLAAAVAEYGMILQGSPHRGAGRLHEVLAWVDPAALAPADDPDGQRAEFLELVRKTQTLME